MNPVIGLPLPTTSEKKAKPPEWRNKYPPLEFQTASKLLKNPSRHSKRKLAATLNKDTLFVKLTDIAAKWPLAKGEFGCVSTKQFCKFHGKKVNHKVLDLSNAEISDFPECLATQLSKVEQLELQNNLFTTVPLHLDKLSNLNWVDLSNNPIVLDAQAKMRLKALIEEGVVFFTGGDCQAELSIFVEHHQGPLQ